ncbi:MAG: GTPase domain-containing protein [Filomicrobium sp.]
MRNSNLEAYIGGAAIAGAIILPVLALVPFGWYWLWEHGYAFYWLGGALLVSVVAFGLRLWAIRRLRKRLAERSEKPASADTGPDGVLEFASPREQAAWRAVEELASASDPADITGREDLIALGVTTVERVAKHMRPDATNPTWAFTVPEALTLVEQVSQNLKVVFKDKIPLGDQLTVGQVMQVYQWRSLAGVAEKAYDLWRIIRMVNPISATAQEIRERLSKAAMEGLREELAKRLLAAYVREVGKSAIDLYSGRLKVTDVELADHVSAATAADRTAAEQSGKQLAEPLRFLVVGQTSAGKSSLINALATDVKAVVDALPATTEFTGYEIQPEGLSPVMLVDSPGLMAQEDFKALSDQALQSDLVIWVVAANRADRDLDVKALAEIRETFRNDPKRRAPRVLLAMTHIDRLRPAGEWQPPYDLDDESQPKVHSIQDARSAVAEDFDLPEDAIVPVALFDVAEPYNIEQLWKQLEAALPEAKSAQLRRCLAEARGGIKLRKILSQTIEAGKLSFDVLRGQTKKRGS